MIRRLPSWILIALPLFLPGTLFGQLQQLGKIIGQVQVARGDFPPHQVLVELRLHGGTIESAYADMQGRFGFYNLEANGYHVVINDEDYYPVDERADVNPDVTPYVMLQIVLRPRESKNKEDPVGTRANGSNPYLIDPANYNKRFPKKAVKEYEKGVDAERKGKPAEALLHYESTLKLAPDYYPAHNNLGSLYLSRSDFGLAEEQFLEAIRLDKNEAQAYFNLSNVFMLTGRYPESGVALASGMQRRPDSAFGYFLEGCLYGRTGKLSEAEKSLQNAVRLDPTMSQAYLQLVNIYLQQNRREDAITELQSFLRVFPDAPAARKAKDVLHKLQGGNAPVQP